MFTNNNDLHMLQFPPLPLVMEKRWNKSSHVEIAPSCPRCASPNTKFCYYNNYSLSQPRYFCKGCRRYWTKGGSLRNVPVGGGCRKYRRSRTKQSGGGTGIGTRTPPNPNTDSSPDSIELADAEPGNIDLAAVYANYLNQNSGSQNYINGAVVGDQDVSSGASCASYDQFHVQNSENMVMEFEKSFDQLIQDDDLYQVVSIGDDNYDHDFVSQTPNAAYDLLNDDNLQLEEITWMNDDDDDVATINNSPNFMWESAVQWQDQFGSIPSHDQLKISASANFINQNWSSSSTDLSGLI